MIVIEQVLFQCFKLRSTLRDIYNRFQKKTYGSPKLYSTKKSRTFRVHRQLNLPSRRIRFSAFPCPNPRS